MTEPMSPVLAMMNTLVLATASSTLLEAGLEGQTPFLFIGLVIGVVAVAFAVTYLRECEQARRIKRIE